MRKHLALALLLAPLGCGGGSSSKKITGYSIENPPTSAQAGDTLLLTVQAKLSDGTVEALPADATLTWSAPTITILAPDSTADSPVPANGATPTVFFVSNPSRTDQASDLANRLFIRDAGTSGGSVTVTGTIAGATPGTVTATIAVSAAPVGNAANGMKLYADACASCHGEMGEGNTTADSNGMYNIDGTPYPFPVPGLNAAAGNAGSDPDWNVAVFAQAARADFDDGGVALRLPMPNWFTDTTSANAKLSTQDLADIFAFMQATQ